MNTVSLKFCGPEVRLLWNGGRCKPGDVIQIAEDQAEVLLKREPDNWTREIEPRPKKRTAPTKAPSTDGQGE